MATAFSGDQVAFGEMVVTRIGGLGAPKELAPSFKAFTAAQTKLAERSAKVDTAKGARDAALGAIAEADDVLDPLVLGLADVLVGAGLGGTRTRPFQGLSKYVPSQLTELAYAKEVAEVVKLCGAVRAKKPAANVLKQVAACEKAAAAVDKALSGLTKPQAAYQIALGSRDAELPAWTKALSKLRLMAKVVWDDEPATYAAVFARPEAVQRPTTKRKAAPKKKAEPPADG